MGKLVAHRPNIEVDLGDDQSLTVRKLGILEIRSMIKNKKTDITEDNEDNLIEAGVDFLYAVVVGWKGICDSEGIAVPFTKEEFKALVESLDDSELQLILNTVFQVLFPTLKEKEKAKEVDVELKNSGTASSN